VKLAEVPVESFGGEPNGGEYRWLDQSAGRAAACEYRVEELESTGELGRGASASPDRR
jgi:hypothetical protein